MGILRTLFGFDKYSCTVTTKAGKVKWTIDMNAKMDYQQFYLSVTQYTRKSLTEPEVRKISVMLERYLKQTKDSPHQVIIQSNGYKGLIALRLGESNKWTLCSMEEYFKTLMARN